MPSIDVVVQSPVSNGVRVRQLEGMFDVPPAKIEKIRWRGDVPIEDREWSVGLIVGPSGSGKSSVARDLFGGLVDAPLKWSALSVVEDFDSALSMQDIASVCSAVGFNTIPAWRRPFDVLSTGERFRVELARRLLEGGELVVVDEFTSVVDRQVAKIGSHAVQKYARRGEKRFVAVTCHEDVESWLQPDWVLRLPCLDFSWHRRRLRPDGTCKRPSLEVVVGRVPYAAWSLFAPFHYLTSELNRSAKCYGLWVEGRLAAFSGMIHFPHPRVKNIKRCSRLVTLPDWQGLGLAFVLNDRLGEAHKACGLRMRCYPAHPALIRSFDRSSLWALVKRPGRFSGPKGSTASVSGAFGGRSCAVFEYVGPAMVDESAARRLLGL